MPRLKRIEKAVAGGMAILSALLLAGIVTLFVMEIFMRYAMNAPTKWSNDVISFIMPAMIFLALPEVTRRNQHIAITFLVEAMGDDVAVKWGRVLALVSANVAALAAWIVASSALKQFSTGILTNTVIQVPKWALLSPIAFSFGVVALIFLTTALIGRDEV
jgi:TRAP-type C4-dicarboxylate transport system permease small subunit